jgi:hypothetical protein
MGYWDISRWVLVLTGISPCHDPTQQGLSHVTLRAWSIKQPPASFRTPGVLWCDFVSHPKRISSLKVSLWIFERETTLVVQAVVRFVIVGAEQTTITVPARAEQARIAAGIPDGFMHRNDIPQTHLFQLFVRECVTDQAGDLPVELEPAFLVGGRTNLLRGTVSAADLLARTHHNVVGDAIGWHFVCATQYSTCMVADSPTTTLEVPFPLFAGKALRGECEANVTLVIDDKLYWFECARSNRFSVFFSLIN